MRSEWWRNGPNAKGAHIKLMNVTIYRQHPLKERELSKKENRTVERQVKKSLFLERLLVERGPCVQIKNGSPDNSSPFPFSHYMFSLQLGKTEIDVVTLR